MTHSKQNKTSPFAVRDCALAALAAGRKAQNLGELCEGIRGVDVSSIYHHFWGRLLHPVFDEPEFNNDFASWTSRSLRDKTLAERLSVLDPTYYASLEDLRGELVDLIETRMDDVDYPSFAGKDEQFHFVKTQIVVFDTGKKAGDPEELGNIVGELSSGSIFYHFIDARRRTPSNTDDFSEWLSGFGKNYERLIDALKAVDPFFFSLTRTRDVIKEIFNENLGALKRK